MKPRDAAQDLFRLADRRSSMLLQPYIVLIVPGTAKVFISLLIGGWSLGVVTRRRECLSALAF